MLSFLHTLLPHQRGSNIIPVDYGLKSCKAQTIFRKQFSAKPKDHMKNKKKDARGICSLWNLTSATNKHSSAPGQINIKPHTKSLLTAVIITRYVRLGFQENNYKAF